MTSQVLIVGPSWVGDMVMAQALFKYLQQQEPSLALDVLAPEWSLPILSRMPEVRRAITMPCKHGEFGLMARFKLGRALATTGYHKAYVLTNSWKSALVPWFARIPQRIGWVGECRYGLLTEARNLDKTALPKMVQRYVALGLPRGAPMPAPFPYPKLSVPADAVAKTLAKLGLEKLQQPLLALCPGAAYGPAKRWPEAHFAAVAKAKLSQGWAVGLFGSPADKPVIDTIASQLPAQDVYNFAGKLDLFETLDVFSIAKAVVSNDSGLMHMAASLDKTLVAIYGSTSPEFTPPLGPSSHILQRPQDCSPCFKRTCPLQHHNCMRAILPEDVLAKLEVS